MSLKRSLPFIGLLLAIGTPGCDPAYEDLEIGSSAPDPASYVDRVTIYRDVFGVPHVHGATDAAAAFGFAYAQAEDNFARIQENVLRAVGRASDVYGPASLVDDWLARALRTEALSRQEYEASPAPLHAVLEAFAAGLNYYVVKHPEADSNRVGRFEPWHPLALVRYLYYQQGFLRRAGLSAVAFRSALQATAVDPERLSRYEIAQSVPLPEDPVNGLFPESEQGSNSMAVGPALTADGRSLLLINPHLPFFGTGQVYEGHVLSDEGWNFSGYTRFGFPIPYVGFNEHLGWASTDNAADLADAYIESFEDEQAGSYRYGDTTEEAATWDTRIPIRDGARRDTLAFIMRRTRHGPIVGRTDGRWVSVKMAKFEETGWMDQWYAMTRANDLGSFQAAVSRLDMLFGNFLYADADGNVWYVYNAAVPRRSEGISGRGLLDGSDPRTSWSGYRSIEELPQVLNPASGWLQNCNGTPFLATASENPDAGLFPAYLAPEEDNARSRAARRVLGSIDRISFDEWAGLAYDKHIVRADELLPALFEAWDALRHGDPDRAERTRPAIDVLRAWDRISDTGSVAMTLFVRAVEGSYSGLSVGAIERTMTDLQTEWGTWRLPWGELNRLQRPTGGETAFSDDAQSLPIAGAPSWAGSLFTFWSARTPDTRRRYGTGGNSYVAVVEFGKRVQAGTLRVFGASADPSSPHFQDQSERYAEGRFKNAPLALDEVRAAAVRFYKPGAEQP